MVKVGRFFASFSESVPGLRSSSPVPLVVVEAEINDDPTNGQWPSRVVELDPTGTWAAAAAADLAGGAAGLRLAGLGAAAAAEAKLSWSMTGDGGTMLTAQ